MNIQQIFDLVLENAKKVSGFVPSDEEVKVIRIAFDGLFTNNGKRFRKNPLTWAGFVKRDGTIDENGRNQSLQSAFGRMFHYHLGRSSAYLGTIINATENLQSISWAYGLCEKSPRWYMMDINTPEYEAARKTADEIKVIQKKFTDHCDTFCQVFVYLLKQGKTSSVNGDIWRKALLGE